MPRRPMPGRTVNLGAQVTLSGSGSDPDEDTLSYSWSQTGGSPTVTLSGANTATASFTAPNNLPPGGATLTFRLTVSDGQGGTDTDDVTITVTR